jgi:hypothetical protein
VGGQDGRAGGWGGGEHGGKRVEGPEGERVGGRLWEGQGKGGQGVVWGLEVVKSTSKSTDRGSQCSADSIE